LMTTAMKMTQQDPREKDGKQMRFLLTQTLFSLFLFLIYLIFLDFPGSGY
jgi:hypothetical protein